MTSRKGTISVQTTDIFPIIKKWLYSEHDIFVRELVSNATDAISKRTVFHAQENKEAFTPQIRVEIDKKASKIHIIDNGLGMTEEEVEKYIAQLAFSGASEFVEKIQHESKDDIIGKFGLGFYSAFMVANNVIINSLSYKDGSVPTKWTCNGETDYTFESSDYNEVGTKITLEINDDNKEFLDSWKLRETLKRYCDFLPYPIELVDLNEVERIEEENSKAKKDEDKKPLPVDIINQTSPLWKKDPSTLKDEDYKNFYKHLFPMDEDPLFWIHLNVDHPFTLQGILYFPKINKNKPVNDQNIKLYSKQVFVSDNVKSVIPDFLALLKGAIDSQDIPLNVSRSALQGDPNIKKISNYIVKKVAEELKKMFKKDRERFEQSWDDIGLFVKYGIISDTKFDELMRDKVLLQTVSEHKKLTLKEYLESVPEAFKEKMKGKVVYFEKSKSNLNLAKELMSKGIQIAEMDEYIDPHFMQHIEVHKKDDQEIKFQLVDNAIEEIIETQSLSAEDEKIKEFFTQVLSISEDDKEKSLELKAYGQDTSAAYFKVDESMKRFQQMTQSMGQSQFNMPVKKTLIINPTHPLVKNAFNLWSKAETKELGVKVAEHIQDLAALSGDGLNDEAKSQFIHRAQSLMQELTSIK